MILKLPSKLWIVFSLAWLSLYETFLLVQTVRTWADPNSSLFVRLYVSFNTFGYSLLIMDYFVVLRSPSVHPEMVNSLLEIMTEFYGTYSSGSRKLWR